MNKRHTLTVFVALFGIVLLFVGSACAAVDFPADDDGASVNCIRIRVAAA